MSRPGRDLHREITVDPFEQCGQLIREGYGQQFGEQFADDWAEVCLQPLGFVGRGRKLREYQVGQGFGGLVHEQVLSTVARPASRAKEGRGSTSQAVIHQRSRAVDSSIASMCYTESDSPRTSNR